MSPTSTAPHVRNVVLVHGGFVDGSGWQGVYEALKKDGYTVAIVQNPTISLADDVAVTKRTLAAQNGPVILVGHSYGGVVITEAGNDPKVAGLVYIAAFAPDKGESVSALIKDPPPGAPVPPILPPQDGYLFLDKAKFRASFAADVSADAAAFMADSQVPWGVEALNGAVTEPAWKTKPSWYLVATDDKIFRPTRSAPCPSAPVRRLSRSRAATPSTCRSRRRLRRSSRRPRKKRQSQRLRRREPWRRRAKIPAASTTSASAEASGVGERGARHPQPATSEPRGRAPPAPAPAPPDPAPPVVVPAPAVIVLPVVGLMMGGRLRAIANDLFRIELVQYDRVALGIDADRHATFGAVDHVAFERHALRLEVGNQLIEVLDLEGNRSAARRAPGRVRDGETPAARQVVLDPPHAASTSCQARGKAQRLLVELAGTRHVADGVHGERHFLEHSVGSPFASVTSVGGRHMPFVGFLAFVRSVRHTHGVMFDPRSIRFFGVLFISTSLAACGSSGSPTPSTAPSNFTLTTPEITVPAGEERYVCFSKTLDEEFAVDRFDFEGQSVVHHVFLSRSIVPEPEGLSECNVIFKQTWLPMFVTGSGTASLEYPSGAATKLRKGAQIVLQLHLLNASTIEAHRSVSVVMRRSPLHQPQSSRHLRVRHAKDRPSPKRRVKSSTNASRAKTSRRSRRWPTCTGSARRSTSPSRGTTARCRRW